MNIRFGLAACLLWVMPAMLSADHDVEALRESLVGADKLARLEILVELVERYREVGLREAASFGAQAQGLLEDTQDPELEMRLASALSAVFTDLLRYEDALATGRLAERRARERDDRKALALVMNRLSDVHRRLGEFDQAIEASQEAMRLYEDIADPAGLAESLNNTGIAYRKMGDRARALDYYLRAHQVFEESGDRKGLATALNNIGIIYRILGNYEESLAHYGRAMEIQRESGDEGAVARLLNNMGVVYKRIDRFDQALELYRDSLEIKQRLGDRKGVAQTLNNIGVLHRALGELDPARRSLDASLLIKQEIGDRQGIARTLLNLGRVHRDAGQPALAVQELERSIEAGKQIGAQNDMMEAFEELSMGLEDMGRHKESLKALREAQRIKNEIFSESNNESITQLRSGYESRQKERRIQALNEERLRSDLELERTRRISVLLLAGFSILVLAVSLVTVRMRLSNQKRLMETEQLRQRERETYIRELEETKAEIENRNAEMERFTYTVSHDLKSPLMTILGFLGFVEKDAGKGNFERMRGDIGRIRAAATQMGRLLDELLELSRAGRVVSEATEVSMKELACEAAALLTSAIEQRRARIEIADDLPDVAGDRARLAEVLQNLIENAVRYMGDQENPLVEVAWRKDDGRSVFTVRDNGIGILPEYHEKVFGLFERLDPSVEGTGIGLALVRRIVEVHGGRVWVESQGAGRGSTFCFTIPAA